MDIYLWDLFLDLKFNNFLDDYLQDTSEIILKKLSINEILAESV